MEIGQTKKVIVIRPLELPLGRPKQQPVIREPVREKEPAKVPA